MDKNTEFKHFFAYNIISLIRDELPEHQKLMVYKIEGFDRLYRTTILNLLKQDVEVLTCIRRADFETLKEHS